MLKKLVISLLIGLGACQPVPSLKLDEAIRRNYQSESEAASLSSATIAGNQRLQITLNDVELSLTKPEGWETYDTEHGIALAENPGPVEAGGTLSGMLVYLWVPVNAQFELEVTDDQNRAWVMLSHAMHQDEYVGDAAVSEPVGFSWDGYDAAYYLLNAGDGTLAMVLMVVVPNSDQLLGCTLRAPVDHGTHIREMLPVLFENLVINDIPLDHDALRRLPETLEFPEFVP